MDIVQGAGWRARPVKGNQTGAWGKGGPRSWGNGGAGGHGRAGSGNSGVT